MKFFVTRCDFDSQPPFDQSPRHILLFHKCFPCTPPAHTTHFPFFPLELAVLFAFPPAPSPLMAISSDIGPASSAMVFPLSLFVTHWSGIEPCALLLPSIPVGYSFPGRLLGIFSTQWTLLPSMALVARNLGEGPLYPVNGVSKSLTSDVISSDDPEKLRRCRARLPSAL
ncbi:hypothetical protein GLYMA_13G027200v4 [Glycine max]|uniref:Uncharacterized protein n=2 Tax=Glycine subgen. Soja TaxID=1462606 RepID=A0A0R0GHL6_SOYBN|nr:hypothetical protein GYH30_034936 [Glycine max]KRH17921.1 hypothetical protein GLYMA_13G027200v4 [Glycine max]RZB70580.1 hypothetical protein D0Y65_035522 [Glycine soja]